MQAPNAQMKFVFDLAGVLVQFDGYRLIGPIEGTVSVLQELKERGHHVYALGNWSIEEFADAKPHLLFLDYFDDILISGECGFSKPDSRFYELAEKRFQLVPEQTVFIDDLAENVHAAIERNWNGLIFEDPRQLYLTLMDNSIL